MQCNFHDRGIRCTGRVTFSAPYCETHAEPVRQPAPGPAPTAAEATNSRLQPVNFNFGAQPVISMDDPRWQCLDQDCPSCPGQDHDPRCHYILERTGTQCGYFPLKDRPFCRNHDPRYREQHRAQSAAGGRASRRPRAGIQADAIDLSLADRSGIQAALHTVIALELVGQISPARSRNIVRALSVAARNFDVFPHRNPAAQSDGYRLEVDMLLGLANNFTEEAAINDAPPEPPPGAENQKEVLKALSALSRVTRR